MVLLITESTSGAVLLSRHLGNYRTIVVGDLTQAQVALRSISPQAVVVDTACSTLQHVNIQQLANEWALSQTVFLSCALPGEARFRQRNAADSILIKPISRETLWDTLRQFGQEIERILVVDDDRDFVRLVERMLTSALKRYQVTCAYSGEEALASLRFQRPDLMLLDLQMPDLTGYQVLEHLRANPAWKHLYVVMVSAQDEIDTITMTTGKIEIVTASGYTQNDIIRWLRGILG